MNVEEGPLAVVRRLTNESECKRLMDRFCWALDARDYDSVVALFTPDCEFGRIDAVYKGHAGLLEVLNSRPADRTTRHVNSNMIVDIVDPNKATGKAYCLVFGHRGPLNADGEGTLEVPDSLIINTAEFERGQSGWRISRWHIGLSFRKSTAAASGTLPR